MLEKYQSLIEKLKQKEQPSLKFVQSIFEMEDLNKWLKFNATTKEQKQRVEKIENQMHRLKEKLCVPDYQLENA